MLRFALFLASLSCRTDAEYDLSLAYPVAWDGDKYTEAKCSALGPSTLPQWLNGYFFGQLSASFGNQSDPVGSKLTHMFDGQGAVTSFHLQHGEVSFSARYYPTRAYKIWDFCDRDMAVSKVAWYNVQTPPDEEALDNWSRVSAPNQMTSVPSVDFWRVGHNVIGGTETPDVGYTFDVVDLNNFEIFKFTETSDILGPNSNISFLNMPIHERIDANGLLWASVAGRDFETFQSYQFLFTVDANKVRTVVGNYSFGSYNASLCHDDGSYGGDLSVFPGYMHSITSTENYVILPITAFSMSVCRSRSVADPLLEGDTRFLVFDKRSKTWATPTPIHYPKSLFITHQMNAYEQNGLLIADMITSTYNTYSILSVVDLMSPDFPSFNTSFQRFTINLTSQSVTARNLLSEEFIDGEFTQFNHNYEGQLYKWTYFVHRPFKLDSAICKMDVQNTSVPQIMKFSAGKNVMLGEPWFVQNPGTTGEDDGVLLCRGLDVVTKLTNLYVINAKDMKLIGYTQAPTAVPIGLHNRFYSNHDLGLADPPTIVPSTVTTIIADATTVQTHITTATSGTTSKMDVAVTRFLILTFIVMLFC